MQETGQTAKKGPQILIEDVHAPWHVCGNRRRGEPVVYARGYASVGDKSLENESLARHMQQVAARGAEALRGEIPQLNGGWGLVATLPTGETFAAADRLRTVPLFFYPGQQGLAVASSAGELARIYSRPMSAPEQLKFLMFGYVSGADTLYDGVFQVQPGEIVEYRPDHATRFTATRYYRLYPTATVAVESRDELLDSLADVLLRMFERFRDGYRGEQVAVPLSGGLDSRLVVGMLKRLGIENCFCYTYGDESQEEVRLSRQVAGALGFRWRCLPQTGDVWKRFGLTSTYRNYAPYGSKGVSAPHAQDFAAVMQLASVGFEGSETIFFPGHSADMNAGSHIPPDYPDLAAGSLSVTDEIVRHHASPTWHVPLRMLRSSSKSKILAQLQRESAAPASAATSDPLACCEMWNAENRQSKYIINSVRIYEFFGARWRTLWDYEFMDFYLRVPTELRYGERLYLDCLRERIFVDELAPLGAIPLPGKGPLNSIAALRRPAARTSIWERNLNALRRRLAWRRLKSGGRHPKGMSNPKNSAVVRLDGLEGVDGSVSFREALAKVDALRRLSPEIQQALAPWLGTRLESMSWLAVHTAIALSRLAED